MGSPLIDAVQHEIETANAPRLLRSAWHAAQSARVRSARAGAAPAFGLGLLLERRPRRSHATRKPRGVRANPALLSSARRREPALARDASARRRARDADRGRTYR